MLIVAITGMPGAGKTTAAQVLDSVAQKRIAMGDMIREETRRRGLQIDDKNLGMVMRELREKYGASAVAELCLLALKRPTTVAATADPSVVVIDGIRSMAEIDTFREAGDVKLIAIAASPARRFLLLNRRRRSDDPSDLESFKTRDERELSIGIGSAIALADEVISNEHLALDELGSAALKLVTDWMKSLDGERGHQ